MKSLAFLVAAIAVFLFVFGCTAPSILNNDDSNVSVANTADCPSSLQACGAGCIPTNAICCDTGVVNGYCLQPSTGCGNGTCNSCPQGQIFCGMFCKPRGEKCCIGDSCGAGAKTNPYVGTYEFKGEYTYHTHENCKETDSDLVSKTLTVRATFEAPKRESANDSLYMDTFTVWITKLWADDPDFGTGADGITPERHDYGREIDKRTELVLPMIPRFAGDPVNYAAVEVSKDYPDGKKRNSISSLGFLFNFPTGPEDWGTQMSFTGHYQEGYYISDDGRTMHSYPPVVTDMFDAGGTWSARSQIGSGPLSENAIIGSNKTVFCGPRFVSWTATKISD